MYLPFLTNLSTTCVTQPQRSLQQLCEHANMHTGPFLSLVMQSLGQSCLPTQSLWITQVQQPTYASMIHSLWWWTCSPFMVALHCVKELLCDWSTCSEGFGSLKGGTVPFSGPMLWRGPLWQQGKQKALSRFIWCLSLTRPLLFFHFDKTACDCVSALMSAL